MTTILSNILIAIFFLTVVFLHNTKKVSNISALYGLQSFIVVLALVGFYFEKGQKTLLLLALVNLIVKVIIGPMFLANFAKKNEISFSDGYYLNTPIALIIIAGITVFAHSEILNSLINIIPGNSSVPALSLACIFTSIFLIINSKSELLQIAGVLSLENGIVMFGMFSGLEQSFGLQIGILFDIFVWIIISIVLTSMIYRNIGSLNTDELNHLTD